MTFYQVLFLAGIPFLTGLFVPAKWSHFVILSISLVGIYWLQPVLPIHNLSFWLPTISIGLSLFVWASIVKTSFFTERQNRNALLFIMLIIIILPLSRYLGPFCCILPSIPPKIGPVIAAAVSIVLLLFSISIMQKRINLGWLLVFILIIILVIVKNNRLLINASILLRNVSGQDTDLASVYDLQWLGFSYLAFRLIQVLRDYPEGIIGQVKLTNFINYALFLPAFSAGPIDRLQRFSSDLLYLDQIDMPYLRKNIENIFIGGQRVLVGLFKKFVIADTLTIVAFNPQIATQIKTPALMWIALYAFSLRIYFDFAGYTDIAIGAGKFLGINLPENFNKPYLQTNITAFWSSWHITLTQWFRVHYFYPLTRIIRSNYASMPTWLVVLFCQTSTMLLIGLWHGINWNFVVWGLWHAFGLFINNRWTDFSRRYPLEKYLSRKFTKIVNFLSWFITFTYIALGWIWFVIPDIDESIKVLILLFGIKLP